MSEIEKLQADLKAAEAALWQFADERNWSAQAGCLQWIGKRSAIEYARDVIEGLATPMPGGFRPQDLDYEIRELRNRRGRADGKGPAG